MLLANRDFREMVSAQVLVNPEYRSAFTDRDSGEGRPLNAINVHVNVDRKKAHNNTGLAHAPLQDHFISLI